MEEKAKIWETITRVLSHRENAGKLAAVAAAERGKASFLLTEITCLISLAVLDQMFDVIGYN